MRRRWPKIAEVSLLSFGVAIAATVVVQGLLLVLLGGYANMRSLVVQAESWARLS
jgi:hypothetical protein